MMNAVGRYIFGTMHDNSWVILVVPDKGRRKVVPIKYCPFCGARLEKMEMAKGDVINVRAKKS